jgi:hypothetical protein
MVQIRPRRGNDPAALRKLPILKAIIQGRQQLAQRKIASRTEHDAIEILNRYDRGHSALAPIRKEECSFLKKRTKKLLFLARLFGKGRDRSIKVSCFS